MRSRWVAVSVSIGCRLQSVFSRGLVQEFNLFNKIPGQGGVGRVRSWLHKSGRRLSVERSVYSIWG
jgi:hypothetical protein